MNAILCADRTGCHWADLPHGFPPRHTVYGSFAKWQKDGIFAQLNGLLRELVRQREGRSTQPSACVIDAQSVKTSASVSSNALPGPGDSPPIPKRWMVERTTDG